MSQAGVWANDAGDPQAFARAHQAMLRRSDLQFDLVAPPEIRTPDWLIALGKLLLSLAPLLKVVFWIGLAAGVVLIVYFIAKEILSRFRRRSPKSAAAPAQQEPEWRPARARALTLLEDADRLAAQGQFSEAVHLILFRSIEDIESRWPNLIRPALTSRDIAEHNALPEAARRTFGDIARMVELSFFGGALLQADDFSACRRAYEAFALPGRR